MDIIALYHKYIYDRYNSLLKSGKEDFDNNDLSKIFEYYTAIKLSEQYGQLFYEYNDIDPNFKELNQMTKNDSGVDLCNLIDTIVQCKLRKQHLNWGECSTFFASQNIFNDETNLVEIKWPKLIIARNSECKLSSNLLIKNKLFTDITYDRDELLEFCSSLFTDLQDTEYPFDLQKADQKSIIPKEEIILRDYQIECIELIRSDKNVIIQLPTGCGKNVIITQYIIKRLYGKCNSANAKPLKFLILVPKIILMEQIRDEFIGLNLPDILDSIQIIGDGNTEFNEDKLITICVYNSIDKIDDFAQFEKIFIDEAHHIIKPEIYYNEEDTNSEYNSEYDSDEDLFDENLEDKKEEIQECNLEEEIQEQYLSKIRKLKIYNNNVFLSATIDKIDEYEYYSKDIRDMINAGYLCDYNIHIPIFSGSVDAINSDINVCKHIIQNYQNIIIYCNTKEEGIEINRIMNDLLPLCSNYVDCDTKRNERKTILEQFKSGEVSFLVNVKILVEGVNFPITKGVLFLHLPSSKTAIIQIIGRALRLHDQKTIANIILPFSNNEDEKTINNFLRILANNDYRIKQSYDNKKLGGYISLNKVEEDCSEGINAENNCEFRFTMIYDNIGKLINSEEIWVQKLEEVKAYIDEFGKRPSSGDTNKYIKSLSMWIYNQLSNYENKKQMMKNEQVYRIWTNFINDKKYSKLFISNIDKWYHKLEKCKQFLDKTNKRPIKKSKNIDEKQIANWIGTQLKYYKCHKYIFYNKKIYDTFKEFINCKKYSRYFISNIDEWNNKLEKCKQFIDKNNRRPINYGSKNIDEKNIANWIYNQSANFKNKKNIMQNEQIYNIWTTCINDKKYGKYFTSNEEIWMQKLEQIKQFFDKNNKKPSRLIEHEKKLGEFIHIQLTNYKNKKDIMKNEQIYNIWTNFINDKKYSKFFMSNIDEWYNKLEKYKQFINENNKRPNQKSKNTDEKQIGLWVNTQLTTYKNQKYIMSNEQIYNTFTEFINDEKYKQYFN